MQEAEWACTRRNLFAGFLIGQAQMVPWWSWYYYINPVAWSLCAPNITCTVSLRSQRPAAASVRPYVGAY